MEKFRVLKWVSILLLFWIGSIECIQAQTTRPPRASDYKILLDLYEGSPDFATWTENGYYLVSPEINLSSAEKPMLKSNYNLEISSDGVNYTPLAANILHEIPKSTKRIRFRGSECNILIADNVVGSTINKLDLSGLGKYAVGRYDGAIYPVKVGDKYSADVTFTLPPGYNLSTGKIGITSYYSNTFTSSDFKFIFKVGDEYIEDNGSYVKPRSRIECKVPNGTTEIRMIYNGYGSSFSIAIYDLCEEWYKGIEDIELVSSGIYDNDGFWVDINNDKRLGTACNDSHRNHGFLELSEDLKSAKIVDGGVFAPYVNLNNDEWLDTYNYYSGYALGGENYSYTLTECKLSEKTSPIDFNNDGRIELLCDEKRNKVLSINSANEAVYENMNVISMADYLGIKERVNESWGGIHVTVGIPSLADGMFGGEGTESGTGSMFGYSNSYECSDINGDGFPDMVNPSTGKIYMNVGNSTYVANDFGGRVRLRDFNGDGLLDYLVYNSKNLTVTCFIVQPDGTAKSQKLISGLKCSSNIWCYDFDKDGDVDILIPFDYEDNSGSYLLMMENKGDGTFKKKENFLDGEYRFDYCIDVDGDGNYEVIARNGLDYGGYMIKINGLKISTAPTLFMAPYDRNNQILHIKGDDALYCYTNYRDNSYKYYLKLFQVGSNKAPNRMAKPDIIYEKGSGLLKIMWKQGSDTESSGADLTYALRVGSSEDKGDMLYAYAHPDGTRRNTLDGNMGYGLMRVLDVSSWKGGKYYISVQAVDPNHRGSQFSEYVIFEKEEADNDFSVSYTTPVSIYDTCVVKLRRAPTPGVIYKWDWKDAELISQDEEKGEYQIRYKTMGEKSISLHTISPQGVISPIVEKNLSVINYPLRLVNCGLGDPRFALDLDEDGVNEVGGINPISYNKDEFKLYEGDEKGNYSDIKKLYNTNNPVEFNHFITTDFNGNGMCDILNCDRGRRSITPLINDADKDMTIGEPLKISDGVDLSIYDFNNDGLLDGLVDDYYAGTLIAINRGGYNNYEVIEYRNIKTFMDYNRDGLVDFVRKINNGDSWTDNICINQGDGIFIKEKEIGRCIAFGDFDGNGKFDKLYSPSSGRYCVEWDDETITEIKEFDYHALNDDICVFDFDNNGYNDIRVRDGYDNRKYAYCIISFFPNREIKISYVNSNDESIVDCRDAVFIRSNGNITMNGSKGYWYSSREASEIADIENETPSAPTNLRYSQTAKGVEISWDSSIDKETLPMSMRYNLSVKHKGASGDGAYLISPCNSGKDGVHVPTNRYYYQSNKVVIPISSIPAGEYEVKVQGIDAWWQESVFSKEILMTVKESVSLKMPSEGEVGKIIEIEETGNVSTTIDWDGGEVISHTGKLYKVKWNSEGIKNVKVNNGLQSIYIYPVIKGDFSDIKTVSEGSTMQISGENMNIGTWSLMSGESVEDGAMNVEIIDATSGSFRFNKKGVYTLTHKLSDQFSTGIYSHEINVTDAIAPTIKVVDIAEDSGKYRISWNNNAAGKAQAKSVRVYKESAVADVYSLLATVPVAESQYVDMESSPTKMSGRYCVAYELENGESGKSISHQPIHTMINRGLDNRMNLTWSKYVGRKIDTYRILRGTSKTNLTCIAEVSGNMTSYTDISTMSEPGFYAVEVVIASSNVNNTKGAGASGYVSRSNVVSTNDAVSIDLITDLSVISVSGLYTITNGENVSLQLLPIILPMQSTIRSVNWVVEEGSDVVSVDRNGLVTAINQKNGDVVVRAYAIDGSNKYGEVSIKVSGFSGVETVNEDGEEKLVVYPSPAESQITVVNVNSGSRADSTIEIININGQVVYTEKVTSDRVSVNCSSFDSGIYYVRAFDKSSVRIGKFIKK